jgi:hypothetical protein
VFFSSVLTSCNELELFDLSGCDMVCDATVQAALDAVKLRPSNIKLKLVVGGELNYSVDISIFCICVHGDRFIGFK